VSKQTTQTTTLAAALKPDRAEIRRALDALTVVGQAFEIRAIDVKVSDKLVAKSRVCHTVAAGVAAAVESWTARGTYFTLNPLKPDLKKNAADADVLGRHLLLTDIDAVRGITGDQNATDAEKQSAIELGYKVRDFLLGLGWPRPIVIDSGNGCHLLHRIELPNDDASRDLVKAVLVELARRFDNDAAKVDTGVFNAARISKLPGTVVRKGPATAERPHRVGRLIDVPAGREIVTRGMLAAIAGKPPAGNEKPTREKRKTTAGPSIENRVIAYIRTIDPAVSGQAGHDTTFGAACRVGPGFDLPPDVAFRLLMDEYNPRCVPPWSEAELRHKVDDAYKVESRRGWLLDEKPPSSNGHGNGHGHGPPASLNWHGPSPPSANGHPGPPDDRPVILVTHEEFEVNDRAIAALGANPELYQRNLKLVTVAIDEKTSKAEGIKRAEGTPLIRPVQPARLREDLTRVARWMKARTTRDGEIEMIPTHPPEWSVAAVMARENWPNIRHLVAIIEAPTLRPDGSVIEEPGFDRTTGLLYIPNRDFPRVPIRPTRADAEAAARDLLDLVSDFPFKDGHHVAWLAALLTAMGRLLIDGPVPLFLFEANVSGAGKTLLCDLIAIIVTGRPMTRTGYAHDPVEMGKQISATALAGDALVLFDNLANGGLFGNPALDRALTGRTWRDRILGKLEMTPNLDLIAVFFASGNNTALCSDVARRIVQNRLECPHEHPEERTGFKIPDLLGHAAKHRGALVIAVLTILRAYILAGRPSQGLTPMDFVAWSGLIRNAVHWSTGIDPCADHHDLADSNPERGQSAALVEAWRELQIETDRKGFTVAEMLRVLGEDKDGLRYHSLRDALAELSSRTKPGELPSSGTIGKKIQAIRGQVFGDKRFVRIGDHNRAKVWGVELVS
jgi:hypothetical protein